MKMSKLEVIFHLLLQIYCTMFFAYMIKFSDWFVLLAMLGAVCFIGSIYCTYKGLTNK